MSFFLNGSRVEKPHFVASEWCHRYYETRTEFERSRLRKELSRTIMPRDELLKLRLIFANIDQSVMDSIAHKNPVEPYTYQDIERLMFDTEGVWKSISNYILAFQKKGQNGMI